jgi:hypothetical protein
MEIQMTRHASQRPSWIIALSFCTLLLAVAVPMSLTRTQAVAKTSPEEFSIMGTWTGHRERIASTDGYRSGPTTLTVTEESGLTFAGTMSWSTPDGVLRDPLVGAFTPGGALMAGSDQEGTYSFELVNANTLDSCYVESGDDYRAVCARLKKQK